MRVVYGLVMQKQGIKSGIQWMCNTLSTPALVWFLVFPERRYQCQ